MLLLNVFSRIQKVCRLSWLCAPYFVWCHMWTIAVQRNSKKIVENERRSAAVRLLKVAWLLVGCDVWIASHFAREELAPCHSHLVRCDVPLLGQRSPTRQEPVIYDNHSFYNASEMEIYQEEGRRAFFYLWPADIIAAIEDAEDQFSAAMTRLKASITITGNKQSLQLTALR
jgi:hypothetical protein